MKIRNEKNGEIFDNVKITQPYKIYSTCANESEVETVFEDYLKLLGYVLGKNFTKRSAKNPNDTFPSKTGSSPSNASVASSSNFFTALPSVNGAYS